MALPSQVLQQLAQQDRDVAMHRFEAVSTSRRLEQTQADVQVIKEDWLDVGSGLCGVKLFDA